MPNDIVIQGITISDNAVDKLTATNKAIWGSLPVVGAVCSELVNNLVPRQRVERISRVLQILDQKIQQLELGTEVLRNLMTTENFVELFEDVMYQAARATSEARREYLASFLVTSLTSSEANVIKEKKLLYILDQLNDEEVIHLKFFSIPGGVAHAHPFYELHRTILAWPSVPEGATEDEVKKTMERADFYHVHVEHLKIMGLCRNDTSLIHTGEYRHQVEPTPIGLLLLKYIGLDDVS